ncbi:MAG: PD-(D/E)XK nuclease family protein [Actinomycetota bacterium]|nr:PD-(D/E)XK nuclease family protein [Actinomycetota bacterium]
MADGTPTSTPAGVYTPVQLRTLDALRRTDEPLVFDGNDIAELRADADTGLADLAERLGEESLFVTKHGVRTVLACEANHLAPDDFTWSPARACGQVSHKAIQLLLNWRGEPTPADLVDEALARLADDERSLGDYVAGLGPGDEADLRGRTVERVTKFLECFPPLDRRWHPMTEAAAQFPVDGPIVLRARVDLVIGRPAGAESRKVIVDLKSGRIAPAHREDLRFYALVETLCRDVPPRKLASFSLDSGIAVTEDVTLGLLRSSLRRTLDAIQRMIELRVEARPPDRAPGVTCRWCRLAPDCPPGTAYLLAGDDAPD